MPNYFRFTKKHFCFLVKKGIPILRCLCFPLYGHRKEKSYAMGTTPSKSTAARQSQPVVWETDFDCLTSVIGCDTHTAWRQWMNPSVDQNSDSCVYTNVWNRHKRKTHALHYSLWRWCSGPPCKKSSRLKKSVLPDSAFCFILVRFGQQVRLTRFIRRLLQPFRDGGLIFFHRVWSFQSRVLRYRFIVRHVVVTARHSSKAMCPPPSQT